MPNIKRNPPKDPKLKVLFYSLVSIQMKAQYDLSTISIGTADSVIASANYKMANDYLDMIEQLDKEDQEDDQR